jgi:hypothetical protein
MVPVNIFLRKCEKALAIGWNQCSATPKFTARAKQVPGK